MNTRSRSRWATRATGAGSLAVLVVIMAGVPAALWSLHGNPVPTSVPSFSQIWAALLQPDTDASMFVSAATWAGWLAWAWFATAVVVEAVGMIRGAPLPSVRGLRLSRRAAAGLLGGVLLLAPATALADPQPGPPSVATAPQTPAPKVTEQLQVVDYRVRQGDSLWTLAEVFLGDPHRWQEIVEANPGHLADPNLLPVDTVLAIPTNLLEGSLYTTQSGDSLWAVAEVLLGDGARWPEIGDEHGQPLKSTTIHPGQKLHIPLTSVPSPESDRPSAVETPQPEPTTSAVPPPVADQAPPTAADPPADTRTPDTAGPAPQAEIPTQPAAPTPAELPSLPEGFELPPPGAASAAPPAPASQPPVPEPTVSPTPAAQSSERPSASAPPVPVTTDLGAEQDQNPTRTIVGISAVAATALLGWLTFRRRQQQHRRRRGEQIALPTDTAAAAESAVRMAADPETLRRLDTALRHIAEHCRSTTQPLPGLLGVFVTDTQLELALLTDIELPPPWERTPNDVWSLAADAETEPAPTAVSPYPALAHLGTAPDTGAAVLINLEHLGHLGIRSADPETATGALRALAVFLALSPLADHLNLTLVGTGHELAVAMGSDRLTYSDDADTVLDRLARHSSDDADALAAQDLDSIAAARIAYTDSEMTAPTVLLFAQPLTDQQQHTLATIMSHRPRLAVAAVVPDDTPATAPWLLDTDLAHATLHEQQTQSHGFGFTPTILTESDYNDIIAVLATTQAPAAATGVATDGAAAAVDAGIESATSIDEIVSAAAAQRPLQVVAPPAPHHDHIWIHLLGKPRVTPLSGAEPEKGRAALCCELAALLVTHPGLKFGQIDALLWPHDSGTKTAQQLADRRQTAMRRLRAWLGETSSGELAFPKHGDRTGGTGYRLHEEVRSDWQVFNALLPSGPAVAETDTLISASDLIAGQPFAHVPPQRYGWAEHLQQQMISTIADTLEELAARHIRDGDLAAAEAIAENGMLVDGSREGLWRLAIVAAHGHDTTKAQRLVDEMIEYFGVLDVDTFEPETDELLRHLAQYRDGAGHATYRIGLAS